LAKNQFFLIELIFSTVLVLHLEKGWVGGETEREELNNSLGKRGGAVKGFLFPATGARREGGGVRPSSFHLGNRGKRQKVRCIGGHSGALLTTSNVLSAHISIATKKENGGGSVSKGGGSAKVAQLHPLKS